MRVAVPDIAPLIRATAVGRVMPAEVNVISGGAMRRFMVEAVPPFEQASGHKVSIRFGLTREMKAEIEPGTVTDAVRSLVGLMVRTGAAAPDIGTVEAFKTVLRRARSISYSKGPSGLFVP